MISPQETFGIYVELVRYLSRRIHREIVLKQRRSYQEVNRLLRYGELDFAWLCTGGYLEARQDFGARVLATPVILGRPLYHAFVIVHRDSSVETLEGLRGKTFAFTDPLSLTGRIYPTYLVARLGSRVEAFFRRFFYTFSHDRAVEAVAHGLADGASVDSHVYEFLLAMKPEVVAQTRIIHVSRPFGAPPMTAGPSLSEPWATKLQEALLKMGKEPKGRRILDRLRVDGFVVPYEDLYEEARRVWDKSGLRLVGP
jgi:phosphonate transport system substrate-binding protein